MLVVVCTSMIRKLLCVWQICVAIASSTERVEEGPQTSQDLPRHFEIEIPSLVIETMEYPTMFQFQSYPHRLSEQYVRQSGEIST